VWGRLVQHNIVGTLTTGEHAYLSRPGSGSVSLEARNRTWHRATG